MSTVHHQPPRKDKEIYLDELETKVKEFKAIADDNKVDFKNVIAVYHTLELRRQNDLYIANGDAWDEQISGVCEAIERISQKMRVM